MNVPGVQESSIAVLALSTVYVMVREILVPTFRKSRQERRVDDRPGHFRCEAGRYDQRITTLEEHDKSDDRRIVTVTEKIEEVSEKLGPMSAKLDVVIERVNWLVGSRS